MNASKSTHCYRCDHPLDLPAGENFSRKENCPHCHTDLHCCKMCLFYDPSSYNECKEPMAEKVLEKEKANFCDYFRSIDEAKLKDRTNKSDKNSLVDLANSLFKK